MLGPQILDVCLLGNAGINTSMSLRDSIENKIIEHELGLVTDKDNSLSMFM